MTTIAAKITKMKSTKMKSTDPRDLDPALVIAQHPDQVLKILDTYGIAVIAVPTDKKELHDALKATKFYTTANAIFKDEFKVAEPTMEEKQNPATYQNRKAGDDAQGMLHQYGTPVHHLLQNNTVLRQTMQELYGADNKYLPNRLRKCTRFKSDSKTLHIEAHELFKEDDVGNISLIPGEIACVVGLTGIRRFGFWYMNGADLKPLKNYHAKHGNEFTLIDPDFMHKHYPGRRRMINIDCSKQPHLIMWRENNPHEISHSPSLSLFLSPVKKFNHTKIKKVTTYQPIEYTGLTYHESDLLGLCYNMGGYEWPSGKKLYQFCHQRAYTHYLPKVSNDYKNSNGKFQMRLIKTGKVDQHTAEYQTELKNLKIVLPKIAFAKTTPNFVVDITKLPTKILYDYGFIPTIKTDEQVAAETLLELQNPTKKIRTSRHGPKLKYEQNMNKYNSKIPDNKPTSAGHLH